MEENYSTSVTHVVLFSPGENTASLHSETARSIPSTIGTLKCFEFLGIKKKDSPRCMFLYFIMFIIWSDRNYLMFSHPTGNVYLPVKLRQYDYG